LEPRGLGLDGLHLRLVNGHAHPANRERQMLPAMGALAHGLQGGAQVFAFRVVERLELLELPPEPGGMRSVTTDVTEEAENVIVPSGNDDSDIASWLCRVPPTDRDASVSSD
jgi:hypothetical protein